jgi:hypothetical protein
LRRFFVAAALVVTACGSQQASTQTPLVAASETPVPTNPVPAPSQTVAAVPAPTVCKTNGDCAMSITRACCSPCALPPFADLKTDVDALSKKCAEIECAMRVPQECKPTESIDAYHAECQNEACVAVRNPPPQQAPIAPATLSSTETCTRDADCVVSNFGSCCSSCQSSAYATSKRAIDARNHRCAIVDCAMDQLERCAPIVDAALYRAVCRAGTCAGVKR